MIDEKKLIEEMQARRDFWINKSAKCIENGNTFKSDMCNIIAAELNTILHMTDEKPKAGEWIPCSEKLPEKYGDYLIAWYHKEKHIKALQNEHYYEICEYSPEEGWLSNFPQCPEGYEVVAWQPLPEPWEGE